MKRRSYGLLVALLVSIGVAALIAISGCQTSNEGTASQSASTAASSQDLFRQALANTLSAASKDVSGSFDIDSGAVKLNAKFAGPASGKNGRLQADMEVNSVMQGVPVTMAMQIIAIENQGKSDEYAMFKNVSSSESSYKQKIESYFAPAIGKWTKMAGTDHQNQPSTFAKDGPLAVSDLLSVFDPLYSLNEDDQKIFLSSVDKNNLYVVDETIENTQFKGLDARRIRVSINKDAFVNVDKEVSGAVSNASDWKTSDPKYADQVFGKNKTFSADVYLDPNDAIIIGVSLVVDLADPITESAFNTTMSKITASILVDYNRTISIEAPGKFYSQQEMDALMKQGANAST
ncbi:MAG: hypothetical protein ACYC6Z_01500 [Thermoleophilia bacterium]